MIGKAVHACSSLCETLKGSRKFPPFTSIIFIAIRISHEKPKILPIVLRMVVFMAIIFTILILLITRMIILLIVITLLIT